MASSTLHSSPQKIPRWTLQLFAVALFTWGVGALYTLRANPELAFFRRADELKQAWRGMLTNRFPTNIVIFGGSSGLFSIRAERLLNQHDLPVLNLGLGAGMGAKVLTHHALANVRPRDSLLIALEPGLLTGPIELDPLGVQFALARGKPDLLRDSRRVDWLAALVDLRPGGYHVFTLIGKILRRQPLYRYAQSDLESDGWCRATVRRELPAVPAHPLRLSAAGRAWLTWIRDDCAARNIRVAYALPWSYCAPDHLAEGRRVHRDFLRQVAEIVPVLKELNLSLHTRRDDFADTPLHLTAEGATLRTDALAESIKSWKTWVPNELNALAIAE